MRKIRNPLTGRRSDIVVVLTMLCAQDGCDGEPYDQMMEAAEYISDLRGHISELREALEAAVEQYAGYPPDVLAEIAPEWLEMARNAIEKVRG